MIRIKDFFDPTTYTLTYVVWDPTSRDAVVIDPVVDYDPNSSTVSEESIQKVIAYLTQEKLNPHYVLETHAHADHLSGSQWLKRVYPMIQVAIGEKITLVQKAFKTIFDMPPTFPTNGSQFDRLLKDGETVPAGTLSINVIFTPGHTPACATYIIGENVFTGDALFMPDYGVGRCDFPEGNAETLYDSVKAKIFSLPPHYQVFTGHDYLPNGRPLRFQSTIAEEKRENIHLNEKTTREKFVQFRTARDKTLAVPRLLLPSVQVNIDAGHLPAPRADGHRYLTIPIWTVK